LPGGLIDSVAQGEAALNLESLNGTNDIFVKGVTDRNVVAENR
jgi:hypothetical protein